MPESWQSREEAGVPAGMGGRSEFIERMKEQLVLVPSRTAVVTVDLHRGHLDPAVATLPLPPAKARQVVGAAARLLAAARAREMAVIHVILTKRPVEARHPTPHRRALIAAGLSLSPSGGGDLARHNLLGSVQSALHPALGPAAGDHVINNKKSFSSFYGTELDYLLRLLGIQTLLLAGVNTNTCLLCTAFDAYNLGYAPVVVADCAATLYGDDLHHFALQNISRCVGWVLSLAEVEARLAKETER